MKKTIFIFLVGLVSLTACKKYDEGPLISFTGKTARLCRYWEFDEVSQNGSVVNATGGADFEFNKDGTAKTYYKDQNGNLVNVEESKWEFIEHKEKLRMTGQLYQYSYTYDSTAQDYIIDSTLVDYADTITIQRLTKKDFWINMTDTLGGIYLAKYKAQ